MSYGYFNIKNILLLSLVILLSYAQKPNQLSFINHCPYPNKQNFISSIYKYIPNQQVQASIKSMFPANKQLLIQGIFSNNSSQIMESIQGYTWNYILHLCIFGVFGVILLIIVPILLCTNFCECCCKRDINNKYTNCQICWPAFCIIVLLFGLIGLSVAIFFINSNYSPQFQDFKCSLGVMTNDVVEGGSYNLNKTSFIGLNNYYGITQNFLSNMSKVNQTLKKNLITNSTIIKNITKQLNILSSLIQRLPNNNGSQVILQYQNPLLSKKPERVQNSTFPALLGTFKRPNTIVFNFHQETLQINLTIQQASSSSDELFNLISQTQIQQIRKIVKDQVVKFQKLQFQIQNSIGIAEKGTYVLSGLSIFISVLMFFGVCCMVVYEHNQCFGRFPCFCGMLWFIGLVWFTIGMIFGLANPAIYHGCQYFRQGFESSQKYTQYIQKVILIDKQTNKIVKNCLSSSTNQYYLYENIIPREIRNNLTKLPTAYPINLQINELSYNLSNFYNQSLNLIQNYRVTPKIDIQNQSMIQQFRKISQTQECFPDVWITSLSHQNQILQCGNLNQKADNNTCKSLDSFQQRSVGCIGCIDTSALLYNFTTTASLRKSLQKRYFECVNAGKKQPINKLITIWQNYYLPKKQIIGEIKKRADQIQPNINNTVQILSKKIEPSYNLTRNWLLTQPMLQYSINTTIAKDMDCRVLGQAIDNVIQIFCNSNIQYVYALRFIYYAGAFIIFFISCFSVFVIGRLKHQKQVNDHINRKKQQDRVNTNQNNNPTSERLTLQNQPASSVNYPYFGPY